MPTSTSTTSPTRRCATHGWSRSSSTRSSATSTAIKTLRYHFDNFVAETRFAGVVGAVHVQAALDSADPVEESTFVNDQLDGARCP